MDVTTSIFVLLCALESVLAVERFDVVSVGDSASKSSLVNKFSQFELCSVKGHTYEGTQERLGIVATLVVDVKFTDESHQSVIMLITPVGLDNQKVKGSYEISGFNVDPAWSEDDLKAKLKTEIICGLFSVDIVKIEERPYYIINYLKVKEETWWCDVYRKDRGYKYIETDECKELMQDFLIMADGHDGNVVDSPQQSQDRMPAEAWEVCSSSPGPNKEDQHICSVGGIKTVLRFFCRTTGNPGDTFGYKVVHLYEDKITGSYTLYESVKLKGTIFRIMTRNRICNLFRFKIDDDKKVHIQYLGKEKGVWVLYCDTFVPQEEEGGNYKNIQETETCTRYHGEGVFHTYTGIEPSY